MITFAVSGIPIPQGSKTMMPNPATGIPVMVDANQKQLRPWRRAVAAAAQQAWPGPVLDGQLEIRITFSLPRPTSVSPAKRSFPNVRPDLDKLVRAVLDGITDAKLWTDDARIVSLSARKIYGEPGALIYISAPEGCLEHEAHWDGSDSSQ